MDAAGARGSAGAKISADRGRLLLETLENRQMMAGDVELMFTDPAVPAADNVSAFTDATGTSTTSNDRGTSNLEAEGEPAIDLVELAKWLDQQGFEMYGADWCAACTQQKDLLEDGGDYLPYTNIALDNASRSQDPQFASLNIDSYPTWILPNGDRLIGVQSVQTLITESGFVNPADERPTFKPIGPQRVGIGSPLHIPVDAYDAEGGPLTVTVTVGDSAIASGTVLTGNRSLRLDMEGYDDMVFELFEQRAPVASGRVAELAESGVYDGVIFHRIIDDFVIQSGDPGRNGADGDGTGGSNLGNFDDEFHPDLQHNRNGVLSFAKSSDDTNNSQFFITEVPTRSLDYNHSIFGQLVEGDAVREALSEVETGSGDVPINTVRINNASVFEDTENSVVMLSGLALGTTNVTFTITDSDGNQFQEIVPVTVTADNFQTSNNSQPYLTPIADPIVSPSGTPATLQLGSVDVEGDPVRYFVSGTSSNSATATVNPTTGLLTVTPAAGFTGNVSVALGVFAEGGGGDPSDTQTVTFTFNNSVVAAPTGIDLRATSDSGSSNTDNITNIGTMNFDITGVTSGATVQIVDTSDNSIVGSGVAAGTTISISVNNLAASGQGSYSLAARQVIGGTTGGSTTPITVLFDTTAPSFNTTSVNTNGNIGTAYRTDLVSPEEGSGVMYALSSFPSGATIVATTGVINWTPTAAQPGENNFTVTLTDFAGNVRTESFAVTVAGEPLAGIKLEATDLSGNVITSLDVGDRFLLNLFGTDQRARGSQGGIFAAYADVVFDGTLVRAVPGATIEYPFTFGNTRSGTINTGLLDELGAVSSGTIPSNEAETMIATIEMEAIAAGSVNFVSDPADGNNRAVLLFFNNNNVPADAVSYGSTSLAIGQTFTAIADSFTVVEDSGVTVLNVLQNDTIISGSGTLSVVSVTQPATGGTVALDSGEVRFTPTTDFVGTAEFTYRVSGPGGVQQNVPITVTVTGTNDPPVGVDDTFNVDAGSGVNPLDVLANEASTADPGETLIVTNVTTPSQGGTVTIAADGRSLNYTPPASFVGNDTFNYTLSDGTSTDTVTVTVTIRPTDNPPTANADTFGASDGPAINEDAAQAAYDVLANDTRDTDNQEFLITALGTPSNGATVSIGSNGTRLLYQPAANFNGIETVTYTIRDSGGGLATGIATFNVASVNDSPPISAAAETIIKGATAQTVLTIADLPDNVDTNETLQFVDLAQPSSGTAAIAADGQSITFTPVDADFSGEVTFNFSVEDSAGLTSGPATMTVTVRDFVRRAIDVKFSSNSFGLLNGNLSSFTLTGTDAIGESITLPLNHSSIVVTSGGIRVPNLLPGSYQLNVPMIPFLHNGDAAQTINIMSDIDEGDESVELNLGGRKASSFSKSDWLGSAPRLAVLAAISPGESAVFVQQSVGAQTAVSGLSVSMNETGSALTVSATRPAAANATNQARVPVRLTANVADNTVVGPRGEFGAMQFVLISLQNGSGGLNLTDVPSGTSTGSGTTGGASTASATTPVANPAAASVSQNDVFVPAGEPLSAADLAMISGDASRASENANMGITSLSGGISQSTPGLFTSGQSSNVDAAMNDLSESLTRISVPGDRVAEAGSGTVQTFTEAVDQVLTNGSIV